MLDARGTRDLVVWRAPAAGVLMVAAGASLWGLDAILRKPLVDIWSSWTIVLYEHLLLTLAVLPVLWVSRHRIRQLSRMGWACALVVAWGGSALATLLFTEAFGLAYANPDVVILLQKTQPLWAIGAGALVLGERPRSELWLALVPAVIGTYLLSFGLTAPADAFTGNAARPALYALTAAALWGAATAFGRRGLREVTPNVLMALRFSLALPLLALIAALKHEATPGAGAGSADWMRLVLLALGSGLVAMILYYRGLRTTPAAVATIAELAFPATALIVNYIWLDATINGWQWAGFIILWGTIVLIHRAPVLVPRGREIAAPPLPASG